MSERTIFVYSKYGEIKVLDIEESKRYNDALIRDGWVHTATIDPCIFIQFLHNDCEEVDLIQEIKSLSGKVKI